MYDFQVYHLKTHLNYNMEEINELSVRIGVQYLENYYDEQMQEKITNLGLHGFDVKSSEQCGHTFKMWMSRKGRESEPAPELTLTPDQADKINSVMQKEIDKAVGKRNLRCQTKP